MRHEPAEGDSFGSPLTSRNGTAANESIDTQIEPSDIFPLSALFSLTQSLSHDEDSTPSAERYNIRTIDIRKDLEPCIPNHLDPALTGTMLGKGTYGTVKRLRNKKNGEIYAVKSIHKRAVFESGMSIQVENEIAFHVQTVHPNVLRCYGCVEDPTYIHLFMECCDAGDLYQYMRRKPMRRFSEPEAFFYLMQLVNGLSHIHSKGYFHRDLKLENILLGNDGQLKIADFGWIARILGSRSNYNFCGTLDYLCPEMIQGIGHDWRVDIWGVGILLYEMITGSPPFHSLDPQTLITNILQHRITFPTYVSDEVRDVIRALLQFEPEKRLALAGLVTFPWIQRQWKTYVCSVCNKSNAMRDAEQQHYCARSPASLLATQESCDARKISAPSDMTESNDANDILEFVGDEKSGQDADGDAGEERELHVPRRQNSTELSSDCTEKQDEPASAIEEISQRRCLAVPVLPLPVLQSDTPHNGGEPLQTSFTVQESPCRPDDHLPYSSEDLPYKPDEQAVTCQHEKTICDLFENSSAGSTLVSDDASSTAKSPREAQKRLANDCSTPTTCSVVLAVSVERPARTSVLPNEQRFSALSHRNSATLAKATALSQDRSALKKLSAREHHPLRLQRPPLLRHDSNNHENFVLPSMEYRVMEADHNGSGAVTTNKPRCISPQHSMEASCSSPYPKHVLLPPPSFSLTTSSRNTPLWHAPHTVGLPLRNHQRQVTMYPGVCPASRPLAASLVPKTKDALGVNVPRSQTVILKSPMTTKSVQHSHSCSFDSAKQQRSVQWTTVATSKQVVQFPELHTQVVIASRYPRQCTATVACRPMSQWLPPRPRDKTIRTPVTTQPSRRPTTRMLSPWEKFAGFLQSRFR